MRIASQWNTIGEVAARAFIQSEREERCSSTSVCPSVHLLSVCPPFVRQIVQLWVDFVTCPSRDRWVDASYVPPMHGKLRE